MQLMIHKLYGKKKHTECMFHNTNSFIVATTSSAISPNERGSAVYKHFQIVVWTKQNSQHSIWCYFTHVSCVTLINRYTNVAVPWQQLIEQCWTPLLSQRLATSRFPLPSRRQLNKDRVCAVCLDDMRLLSARVTPCQHVLHTYCLRKCIQSFHQCPLCKQPL